MESRTQRARAQGPASFQWVDGHSEAWQAWHPGSTESSLVQAVVQLPAAWQSAGAAQISGGCGDWPRTRAGRAMIIISWLLSGLSFVEIARALSFELYEV